MSIKIVVIMTCHNRKELTLEAVMRFQESSKNTEFDVEFIICDDGSTDGTYEALIKLKSVTVLRGSGNEYWAGGMALVEKIALQGNTSGSYLVWLNDDVVLDIDALVRIKPILITNAHSIVVCAMRNLVNEITYSGLKKTGWYPHSYSIDFPIDTVKKVATFNGNLVFIPFSIARKLDGIDSVFIHTLADIDYGLRATKCGVNILLAPGTFGLCLKNETQVIENSPILEKWRFFIGPKGSGNFKSLKHFTYRHKKIQWPFVIVGVYSAWWLRAIVKTIKNRIVA